MRVWLVMSVLKGGDIPKAVVFSEEKEAMKYHTELLKYNSGAGGGLHPAVTKNESERFAVNDDGSVYILTKLAMVDESKSDLPDALYPFLYMVKKGDVRKFFVIIANPFDYHHAETKWMNDSDLPDEYTMEPGLDLMKEKHEFKTELEAILFIKEWWKKDTNWK